MNKMNKIFLNIYKFSLDNIFFEIFLKPFWSAGCGHDTKPKKNRSSTELVCNFEICYRIDSILVNTLV